MKKIILFSIVIALSAHAVYARNIFETVSDILKARTKKSSPSVSWIQLNALYVNNKKYPVPAKIPMYKNQFYIRSELMLLLLPEISLKMGKSGPEIILENDNLKFSIRPDGSYAFWDNNQMKIDGNLLMINNKPYIPLSMAANMAYAKAVYNKQTKNIKLYKWKGRTPEDKKPSEIYAIIRDVSRRTGVEQAMIKAIIRTESNFNPKAVSKAGAIGLMQLMPATARSLGVNPYDPYQNVFGGTTYYKKMLTQFKTVKLALAAYNAGPGNVKKYGGIPPFPETQNYVKKVLKYYEQYKKE